MRRYIFDTKDKDVHEHNVDVAVIGSGLAGMYAAYHLDTSLNCALFAKEAIEISSSSLAQGGIAAVTEKDDHFIYHFQDTINAGAGLCDEAAVSTIVEEGPKEIDELLSLGTHFDLDSQGHLLTTREGGHGMSRILHAGGDATGLEMVRTLKKTGNKEKEHHALHENSFVADIITQDDVVTGLMAYEKNAWHFYHTRYVIACVGWPRADVPLYDQPERRDGRRICAGPARGRGTAQHRVHTVFIQPACIRRRTATGSVF